MTASLVDIFLHLDKYLSQILSVHRTEAYVLLFVIIFMETGFVFTPFLPGDSLLFAAGAIAALGGMLSIPLMLVLFYVAAISGDTLNYHIGKLLRKRVSRRERIPLIKMEHIDRTQAFFERHGGKTITIARFIPIIRTFAPFIAGVGNMPYKRFLSYNVVGGMLWVTLLFVFGYFFGNIAYIKEHFGFVTIAIIAISSIPVVFALVQSRMKSRAAA